MTSSYQMAVLLQCNESDTLSLEELVSATLVPKEILAQVLAILVKAKVLMSEELEQYDLNPGFQSKKVRVNLNRPLKTEAEVDSSADVLKTVNEERKYIIQATIVRIMKDKKRLKKQDLMQEVISQLSQRFTPQVSDIVKAIDMLLEKDYIEHTDSPTATLSYVA